jgi:hypothetical protein
MHPKIAATACVTVAALIAGCATAVHEHGHKPIVIKAPFDAALAMTMVASGPNTVRGNASIDLPGGLVVTCAGFEVNLVPGTAYARERLHAIYGPALDDALAPPAVRSFFPEPAEYRQFILKTQCDSEGRFVFRHVVDGEFYAIVAISWDVGGSEQGGYLVHRVSVTGGRSATISMGPIAPFRAHAKKGRAQTAAASGPRSRTEVQKIKPPEVAAVPAPPSR